jgi:hypothetical protein
MNVELHLRSEADDGAKLYEVTVDGKAFLGIVGNDDMLHVIAWDEHGEAHTVWDTTPSDLYSA